MYLNLKLLSFIKGNQKVVLSVTVIEFLQNLVTLVHYLCWAFCIISILHGQMSIAVWGLIISVLISLLEIFLYRVSTRICAQKGSVLKSAIRIRLFQHLFSVGPQYVEQRRSGELVTTLWEKVEWLSFYYIEYLPRALAAIVLSIFIIGWTFLLSPMIGASLLICSLFLFITPSVFYPLMKKSGEKEWQANDAFFADCLDGVQGINTLKAFNVNDAHRKKVKRQAEVMRKSIMKNLVYTTANSRAIELFTTAGQYVPFLVALFVLAKEELSSEESIVLFFVLIAWKNAAEKIMGAWLKGNKGIAGLENMQKLFKFKGSDGCVTLDTTTQNNTPLTGDVIFDHVTFTYDQSDKHAVEDISFCMKQGQTTAFIGPSGSGKSTIARLLFGFYKPQKGNISIGSTVLQVNSLGQFRSSIAAIWQDSHIFNCSCMDNIRMSKPTASDEEVYEAARKANLHDFIVSLPQGYQTNIGDGGRSLSGGEKQRVAIARAFLRDAPILILDEATSSLDRKNEMEIYQSLQALRHGKTVMMIAHRLDTIRNADQICVMNKGQIVEKGTHHELMETSSLYRSLVAAKEKGRDVE